MNSDDKRQIDWNDPYLDKQWGLKRIGLLPTPVHTINAQQNKQNKIKVCIVDSGIDYNHPDLKTSLWKNTQEISQNEIDDDQNGFIDDIYGYNFNSDHPGGHWDNMDDYFHGTHIAGIIAATVNNAKGIAGIIPPQQISLVSCKFTKTIFPNSHNAYSTGTDIQAVQCMDYCNKIGAHIIVTSFGVYNKLSRKIQHVIDKYAERGQLLVAAAGNDMLDMQISPFYPAAYDSEAVFAVGAVNEWDEVQKSNFGYDVDIFAPGIRIISTESGGGYTYASGSSFATPFVAGACALILAEYAALGFDVTGQASVAKHIIISSTDQVDSLFDKCRSGGVLNVANSLKMIPSKQYLDDMGFQTDHFQCLPFVEEGLLFEGPCPANGYSIFEVLPLRNRKLSLFSLR